MIGSGLKKLARKNGMKIDHGVAYGAIAGFAATLSEGAGFKRIDFTTTFPDAARKGELMFLTSQTDLSGLFRIQACEFQEKRIVFIFTDNPGTMDRIRNFLAWFSPLLKEYGATGADICTHCGCPITAGHWALVDGTAYRLHAPCAERTRQEIEGQNEQRRNADTGSYGMGALGAFLGAGLGGIVWAFVLYLGYFASIMGLLIGFLAQKGYDLLHGKQGKGKVVILILAVIFSVVFGTFATDAIVLAEMIGTGELIGFTAADIPSIILEFLIDNAEYRGATITNILAGLFFAALGVIGILLGTGKELADKKYLELK